MYKNILVATDGSKLAGKAVEHGIALAKSIGAKITVLSVSVPFPVFTMDPEVVQETPELYNKRMRENAAKLLSAIAAAAKVAGVPCETLVVEHEHPYEAIINTAKSKGCDLITMASHGRRGVSAIVLGSETVKVLTHSSIPVLVHR